MELTVQKTESMKLLLSSVIRFMLAEVEGGLLGLEKVFLKETTSF